VSGYYEVPAGTKVDVCRYDEKERKWTPHTTKECVRGWMIEKEGDLFVLRKGDWLIRALKSEVTKC
jgi:hypothetical protein